jgi:hypothetical protein
MKNNFTVYLQMSCRYRDALGVPGEGVHSYRLFNSALADVGLLLLFAWLVKFLASLYTPVSYALAVLISFLIGVVLHRVFCVRTTVDRILFP